MRVVALMAYVMGVDIGGTNTRALAVDFGGQIIGERIRLESDKDRGLDAFLEHIALVVQKALPGAEHGKPLAVGVGLPGPVNPREGVLYSAPALPFVNVNFAQKLGAILGVPTFVDNDANCAAFGEHRFGAAQNMNDFLMLTFGTGIGGGIFMDGKIRYGKSGGAAEIGHLCVERGGRPCNCGRRGCVEQYLSAINVMKRAGECGHEVSAAHEIYEAEERGEVWAIKLLSDLSFELASVLGSLINVFEPQGIVMGGGLFVQKYENFLQFTREKLQKEAFPSALKGFELLVSAVPGNAGLLGAAALAMSKVEVTTSKPD